MQPVSGACRGVEQNPAGIEKPLATASGDWGKIPITYAGGVHSFKNLEELSRLGGNRLNVTIGSLALVDIICLGEFRV